MIELTQEEVLHFMRVVLELQVPDDVRFERGQGALDLLNLLIPAFLEHEPFQGVTLLAADLKDRHRPTWAEIKADVFSRRGGLCFELNGFFFYLLRFLGYDASLAHSTCTISEVVVPQTHVVVYVQDVVVPGDRYVMDVGVGCGIFQAIDVGFDKESPVYFQGGIRYKYVKHEGKLLRMHEEGQQPEHLHPLDFFIGTFKRFYWAEWESYVDFSHFFPVYDKAYSQEDQLAFHKLLYFSCFPGRRQRNVKGNLITTETEQGVLEERKARDDDDIVAFGMKCMPQLGEQTFRKALANMWAHRAAKARV